MADSGAVMQMASGNGVPHGGFYFPTDAQLVQIADTQSYAADGSQTPLDLPKLRQYRRVPDGREWRALGFMGVVNFTTTGAVAVDPLDFARAISPISLSVGGWPYPAYREVRGDALRWLNLALFGKVMGIEANIAGAGSGRVPFYMPLGNMVGWDVFDSAPRCAAINS